MSDERHPFLAGSDEEGFDALALERESLDIWRECAADAGYDIARTRLTWREEAESLAERGIVLADLLRAIRSQNQALQERAEKAEARLQLAEDALAMYQAGAVTHISIESRPT